MYTHAIKTKNDEMIAEISFEPVTRYEPGTYVNDEVCMHICRKLKYLCGNLNQRDFMEDANYWWVKPRNLPSDAHRVNQHLSKIQHGKSAQGTIEPLAKEELQSIRNLMY